ncbi:MAG: tetratricopeptide repeat protein [Rhodospirillaceae bacterium]|nr:tetratricopeptide repeat protein [Rhodospirillaceae bacterium]
MKRPSKKPLLIALVAALSLPHALFAATEKPVTSNDGSGLAGALLSARHARATEDSAIANDYYTRALQLDPANTSLLQRSYSAAANAGKIDVAIIAAKKYYDAEKTPLPMTGLLLATGHFAKKEFDQAWPYIDRIPADSYLSFAMPMVRAWGQAAHNTPDAALAELAPLQSAQGLGDVFHIMSGLLNEHLGRDQDALIHYESLASRADRQPLSVIRIIAAGYHRLGKSAEVPGLLAKFNQDRGAGSGLYGMVESLSDKERVPKKITLNQGMAESFFAISQILAQSSNNNGLGDVAIGFGQMALYLSPDLPMARWVLGSTLAARRRFEEANSVLNQSRKTDPAYLASQIQVVQNLEALDQRGDALTRLQAIARDCPAMAEIPMAMGNLLRRDEKFADAVLAYDKAKQLYADAKEENWALHYGRGVALERTKQWARAEADFKRALELNPDQPDVLNYLGYSWIDRGENIAEARKLIELAYSRSPENGFIVDSLGWVMYLAGEYPDAVSQLERAVELEPADATLNDHLGDVYWKVGRRNEARFQWRRALTLKPDEKQKASLQTKLEQGLAQN